MKRCPGAGTEEEILEWRQISHKTLLPSSSCQEGRRKGSLLSYLKERDQSPPTFKRQFQTELCVNGDTLQKASLRHLRDILMGALQPGGCGECSLGQILALPTLTLLGFPKSE